MNRLYIGVGVVMILSLVCRTDAAIYGFTHIADVNRNFPAINNSGTVGFSGAIAGTSSPGVYTGAGGPLTTVLASGGFPILRATSINASGDVAFVGSTGGPVFSTFRGNGAGLTTIASNALFGLNAGIADDGAVSFIKLSDGVYKGNGIGSSSIASFTTSNSTQYQLIFDETAMSGNGNIAYQFYTGFAASEVRTIVNGVPDTVISVSGSGSGVNSIAINNAGVVALSAVLGSDSGLFLVSHASMTKVATSSLAGPYSTIAAASLNDHDNYAFYATRPDGSAGIFTGTNPLTDKIIATGDTLDGAFVMSLAFGNDALNDSGQVAFFASLSNGHSGIYSATIVPEPACIGVLALAVLSLRRR